MSALDLTQAEVVTETGVRFVAPVANLASTGLFLRAEEPLQFGQRLSMRLLGVAVRGEVLFISERPKGAVVGVRAAPAALATLEAHRSMVEVLDDPSEEPWSEDTPSDASSFGPEPTTQELPLGVVPPGSHDLTDTPLDLQIDPDLVAAATNDDLSGEIEVSARPRASRGDAGPITAADIPVLDPSDVLLAGADDAERTWSRPGLRAVPERLDEDTRLRLVDGATAPAGAPLPVLERDGFTVRFSSFAAYQAQFSTHIRHGGLVVQAGSLAVGTQRMLSLVVPTVGTYSVSARVIFHTTGKVGFMLDSFNVHRERLAAMAEAS